MALRQAEALELPPGTLRSLPPLAAVRAFEAAVRLQSFSGAAREMNLSAAAVSYQIKELERRLGLTLFQRLPRKVVLTRAGEQIAPAVLDAFRLLHGAFASVAERATGELAITTLPTFASSWLAPRLGGFSRLQPGLQVRLDLSVPLVELELGAFDVSIRTGAGEWDGMASQFLMPDVYAPLLSPALAARAGGIQRAEDLRLLPLLGRASFWRQWLEQEASDAFDPTAQLRIDFGIEHLDVSVALAGDGVALASPLLFAREIARGALVQPLANVMHASRGFWLVYPSASAKAPKIVSFTRWLLSEARSAMESSAALSLPAHTRPS